MMNFMLYTNISPTHVAFQLFIMNDSHQGEVEKAMTLTKADLIQQIYNNHKTLTKSQSTESVETFLALAKTSLISGQDLLLSGFGKFNVKDKKSRRGRNPQTGDELLLDARRVITFKPSGILRSKINNGN